MPPDSETPFAFAALILADAGVKITAEKLLALVRAAGVVKSDPAWAVLFARALMGKTGQDAKKILLKSKMEAAKFWRFSHHHRHPKILPEFALPNTCFRRWSLSKQHVEGSERSQKARLCGETRTIHDDYARINFLTFRCAAIKLNRLPSEIRLQIFREVFPRPSTTIKYYEQSGSTVITVLHGSQEWRVFQRPPWSFSPDSLVYVAQSTPSLPLVSMPAHVHLHSQNLEYRFLSRYKYWLDPAAVGQLAYEAAEVIFAHAVFVSPSDTDALVWLGNEACSMHARHLILGHGEPDSLVALRAILGTGLSRLQNLKRVDLLHNKRSQRTQYQATSHYGVHREMFDLVKDLVKRGLEVNYVPFIPPASCQFDRHYGGRGEDYECHEGGRWSDQEWYWRSMLYLQGFDGQ